jgi:hypothetical protein
MSVFRVQLNNRDQGLLDKHPTTGVQMTTSKQRQVYVMGPNHINRLMVDGETFSDCNYWKKFAYPQVPLNEAFIYVQTDDGSVYSDDPAENVFPKVYSLSVDADSDFEDNQADILTDTGGYAVFCQITNFGTTGQDVTVRLNGKSTAVFTLEDGTSQVFNAGDLALSLVEIANDASGATGPVTVEVLCSVRSACTS